MDHALTVILAPKLEELFLSCWESGRVIFFSAPCGCGKTTAADALLRGHHVCRWNAADTDFAAARPGAGCDAVLADDLQMLQAPERQAALCELIRTRTDLHFVLLSRGRLPGWLMPFQLAGILQTIETPALLMDRESARRMLAARGVTVTPSEMGDIQRDLRGYPLVLELLCRHMTSRAGSYNTELYHACTRDLFVYYDEAVFRRFAPPMRSLLLSIAPFERFTLELARMVSGNPRAGELLGTIQRDTTMLLQDGQDNYRFWPIFLQFLRWELQQSWPESEQRTLYARAALYYELHDELDKALNCYSRAGESAKVSALLSKNAEQHPGVGHYRELQDYYYALPREEILQSPTLMCGMSMLTAMCMDYDASEQWYQELAAYAARLKKSDSEYREVRGRLAYLDIALPQRGCRGLVEIIGSVFRVMTDRQMTVPEFSVTSTLPSIMNGGKDFCEWSKKDELLYATMRGPVEAVLGRDGIGLSDCAICESKFEKGEDVSRRLLTLMTRLGEIQAHGTPDIEFAVLGLLARVQLSEGKAATALESMESLRVKYLNTGQVRFLGNIDALLCRIQLHLGDMESAHQWLENTAPKNDARLWTMWRYQYLTRALVQYADGEYREPLLLLARLLPYCERCGRVMDGLHILLLMALCHERLGDAAWKEEMRRALDLCWEYEFIAPAAEYGAVILPLLGSCGWNADAAFLERLQAAARTQAVQYPRYLRPPQPPGEALSAAELQVLRLLCQSLSNQEIGAILGIKLATVKTHVSHILQKLGVSRRSEARDAAESLHLL